MNAIRKIMQIFIYLILTILVIFSIYTFVCEQLLKKDYVNVFGYTYFIVSTGSMEPALSVNDIIIVKLDEKYKTGDIVTYKEGNSFITHRIISSEKDSYITKGDANNTADGYVTSDAIIGKVVNQFSLFSLFKLIGGILILFVLVSIINFEKIFKRYVIKEDNPEINQVIKSILAKKDGIEILNIDGENEVDNSAYDFMNDVANILDVDREPTDIYNIKTIKKLKYVYRISLLLIRQDKIEFRNVIQNPNFDVKIDYDLEKINFTKKIRETLDEMPIYVYIKIMLIAILYGKDSFYDVVYKVMKLRTLIDAEDKFIESANKTEMEEIIWALEIIETIETKVNFNLSKERKFIEAKEKLDEK